MCDGVYIVNDGLEKTVQGDRTHTEIPGFCLASRSFIILSIFPTNAVKNKLMSSINIASNLQEFIDCIAYECFMNYLISLCNHDFLYWRLFQ